MDVFQPPTPSVTAGPGDTIVLAAGHYSRFGEFASVTLKGEDREGVVVTGPLVAETGDVQVMTGSSSEGSSGSVKVQVGGNLLPQVEHAGHRRILVVPGHNMLPDSFAKRLGGIEVRKAL